jgi:hypothetical protein
VDYSEIRLTTHVVVGSGYAKAVACTLCGADISAVRIDTIEVGVQGTRVGVSTVNLAGGRVWGVSCGASSRALAFVEPLVAIVCQCVS